MIINELINEAEKLDVSPTAKYYIKYFIRCAYNCGITDTKSGAIHKERIEMLLRQKANNLVKDKINKN